MKFGNKFQAFEHLLSEISESSQMQNILKASTIEDLRYVFQHSSLYELRECLSIASNKEQYELCAHLKQLIKEKSLKVYHFSEGR